MQSRMRKLIELPPTDRRLLASAIVAVIRARITVTFVPVRKILQLVIPWTEAVLADTDAAKIGWAVETAGRIVPTGDNCLVKAIAARAMLARRGVSSRLRLGIAKNSPDILLGHAWLECGDRIITGEGESRRYAAMPVDEHYADGSGIAGADGVARAPSSVENP
jgi:Transglutaminase-like superfamily